jgi:hypothetical protein
MQQLLGLTRLVAYDVQLEVPIEVLGPVDRHLKLHPLVLIRALYRAVVAKVTEE